MKASKENKQAGAYTIRVAGEAEVERFNQLLNERHPQEAPHHVGRELRLVIEQSEEWIGLMLWSSGCQRLQDREEKIGWSNAQRAQRLNLIVQLRRYLLLHKAGTRPNLASEALAAATRALPDLWGAKFGCEPLLLESFSDIEAHAGTCYKAAGWIPAGMSKGYAKHRGDLYSFHGRPKKLWLRPLHKKALEWLRAPHLPKRYEAGATAAAHGQMPLKAPQMRSLADALRRTPDPRARNRQYPLGALLCVIAMALLSGARDVAQIQRFSWRLLPAQRAALGFRRRPGKATFRMPGYSVYRDILIALDLDAFAHILSEWLKSRCDGLPAALAMDGKMIRDTIGVLSIVDVKTGVPVAMHVMTQKEGDGAHCEKMIARQTLQQFSDGQGALVTGDALHADKTMAGLTVERGWDYLLQVKGNQPTIRTHLAQKTADTPFLT